MRDTLKVLKDVETRKSLVAKAIRDGNVSVKDFMSLQEQYAFVYKDHSGNSALGMGRSGSANLSGSTNDYIQFIITTLEEDRDGDIVVPMGRVGKNYANNPVWFFGHQEWEIPIGTSRAPDGSIAVVSQRDKCISNFYPDRADPDAMFVFGKVQRGILNATSIAFVPLIAQRREEMYKSNPRDTRPSGWRFDSWDHTETSIVGVPANAGAIRDSLDKEKSFITPRLQKALKPYAAKSRKEQGIVWSGWCPNGDCTVKKSSLRNNAPRGDSRLDRGYSFKVGDRVQSRHGKGKIEEVRGSGRLAQYIVEMDDGEIQRYDGDEIEVAKAAKKDCGCKSKSAQQKMNYHSVASLKAGTPLVWNGKDVTLWSVIGGGANDPGSMYLEVKLPSGKVETVDYREVQTKSLAESSGTSGGYTVPTENKAFIKVECSRCGTKYSRGTTGSGARAVCPNCSSSDWKKVDQKSVPPCECGGKPDCPCGNKKSVAKSEYTEMSDAKLKKEAERVRAELDRERDAAWAKHGSHVGAGDLIRLEGPQSNLAKLSSRYNLLVHEAKTNRGLTLKELAVKKGPQDSPPIWRVEQRNGMWWVLSQHSNPGSGPSDVSYGPYKTEEQALTVLNRVKQKSKESAVKKKTPVKQPVAKSKPVRKADMDEEDRVMKDEDAHDLIAEDIEMEEPFTVKPSAASIVKTYQHAKAEAEFLDDEIAKLDHPGIEEGLTKYKAKYVDPRMEHLKGMLHTHHAKGEGDPDEFLDKCMKGMETDGTGGSETDPGEEGMVQAGEIPPEDEVVSKRRKSMGAGWEVYENGKGNWTAISGDGTQERGPYRTEAEALRVAKSEGEKVEDKDLDLVEWAEQEEAEPEHEEVIDEEVGINPDEDTEEILERYQHPKNLKWYTRKVGTAKRVGNKLVLVKEAEFLEEEEEVKSVRKSGEKFRLTKDPKAPLVEVFDASGEIIDSARASNVTELLHWLRQNYPGIQEKKSLEEDNISEEVEDKDATEEIVEEKSEDDLSPEDMERLKQLTNRLKDYGFAI